MPSWKRDENGNIVVDTDSGNPIWIGIDGKELPYDPEVKQKQISEVTAKSNKRKEDLEAARAILTHLDGIEDIPTFLETAKQNAETVAALKDKDRETEESVARRIQDAVRNAVGPRDAALAKTQEELSKTKDQFHRSLIGSAFLGSSYVSKECRSPALVEKIFGSNFKVTDEGQLVGLHPTTREVIFGDDGREADFDGAIARMIADSPFRDDVLRPAPGGAGTPAQGGRLTPDKDKMSSVDRIALGLQNKGIA